MIRRWLTRIAWCVLVFFLLWLGGLAWFLLQIPSPPGDAPSARADAIVVLTGGKGRIERGLALLTGGNAKKLFISGAGQSVSMSDIVRQAPPPLQDEIRNMSGWGVFLGNEAENTIGNAEETLRWMKGRDIQSVLLVTSHYHMPRSVSEFKAVMPGVTLIPAPVFSDDFTRGRWWQNPSRALLLSEYHKFLAGKLRHLLLSATPAP